MGQGVEQGGWSKMGGAGGVTAYHTMSEKHSYFQKNEWGGGITQHRDEVEMKMCIL